MNFSLALTETPREILIDGTSYVLVRKSALDALYTSTGAGDRAATQRPVLPAAGDRPRESQAMRTVPVKTSRPAPKKKAPSALEPVARPAVAPDPEAGALLTLRAAVLIEIRRNPGATSLEVFEIIRKKIPTTTSGSVYTAIKTWVAKGLVEGRPTEPGPKGWYPVRAARTAAGGTTITPSGPNSPIPENASPDGSRATGAARAGAAV